MAAPRQAAQSEQFRGPPLHLLVFAFQHQITGTVTIDTESGQRHQIYFHEGAPAKVLLADNILKLDSILLRMGTVSNEALIEAARVAYEEGKLLGRMLVARGLITEDTLAAGLRWQVQEKVSHLMKVSDRTLYTVQRGQNHLASYGGVDITAIDPLVMIMVAARLPECSTVLDRNANELRGLLLGVPEGASLDRLFPTEEEQRVVDLLLAQPHSVDSLIDAGADEKAVKVILFGLSTAQLIEEIEEVIEDFEDDEAIELDDDALEVALDDDDDDSSGSPQGASGSGGSLDGSNSSGAASNDPQAGASQSDVVSHADEPGSDRTEGSDRAAGSGAAPVAPPQASPMMSAAAPPETAPNPQLHGFHSAPARATPSAQAMPSGQLSGSGRPDPFWDEPLYDEPPVSNRAGPSSTPASLDPGYESHEPDRWARDDQDEVPTSSHDVGQSSRDSLEAVTSQRVVDERPSQRSAHSAGPSSSREGPAPVSSSHPRTGSPSSQQPRAVARVQVKKQQARRGQSNAPQSSQPRASQPRASQPNASQPRASQSESTKQSIAGNILRKFRGEDEASSDEHEEPVIPVDKPDWCMADFDGLSGPDAFAIAEESLKVLNYAKAEAAAAKAVSEDEKNSTYRATHAWIAAKRLGSPPTGEEEEWYKEQLAVLTDVVIKEPNFELAYYYRARIYKSAKLMKKAIEDFEMCTMLNPGNIDAQRELKEYKVLKARRRRRRELEGPSEPEKKGFLDWVSDKVKG
jgi:hypothetical protein